MSKMLSHVRGGNPSGRRKFNDMVDAVNPLLNMRGSGGIQVKYTQGGVGLSLSMNQLLPRIPKGKGSSIFWAEITGNTSLGSNQWTYSFKEVEKTSAGYGGWTDIDNGRTGTDTAYNFIEDMNDGLTTEGNGVDVDNLDTADYTFTIQPAPTGLTVEMHEIFNGTDMEFWFMYENGVDGTCD